MKDKDRHSIPNPKDFTHEIAEETRLLRQEISEGINHICYPLDLRHNDSLKNLSHNLLSLLEKKLWLRILIGMGLGAFTELFLGPFGGYVNPAYA